MYSVDGDFGKVRLAHCIQSPNNSGLFSIHSLGWHKCNDRYGISRPKGHKEHLILITVGGNGIMKIENKEYQLTAGTIAFIPRNTKNSYKTSPKKLWEFYWIHPAVGLCEQFLDTIVKKGIFLNSFTPSYNYAQKMEELLKIHSDNIPENAIGISQKISELMHMIAIDLDNTKNINSFSNNIISYIKENYSNKIEIEDIAQKLYISPAHLIRIFKKETGLTPHQYLIQYRLLSSIQLLKYSDMNMEQIAKAVGFSSSSHFISSFKKQYGCTPFKYNE